MSKTIDGVPEFFTREQYLGLFEACGVSSKHVFEMRMAADGVHVLVAALDENGERIYDGQFIEDPVLGHVHTAVKHRIFIPVRQDENDARVARVTEVGAA